jgi:putative methionine-R-sulfoxide reductase with GAF domain
VTAWEDTLSRTAGQLAPHRDALLDRWTNALVAATPAPEADLRSFCARSLDAMLARLTRGEVEQLLRDEADAAAHAARTGASFLPLALAIRELDRCCLPFLLAACPEREELAEALVALDELADRRLEVLLREQEQESQRRLIESEEQGAQARERARDLAHANEALRRSDARSKHRADQIALFANVAHGLSPILEPERLMQAAAEMIRTRMNHNYVAVVVLDDEEILVGRWAGRPGVGRTSSGRAQGPAKGVIGRALRKQAPQLVPDVSADPDYVADVPGTRAELVVPLLEQGEALGAIDFQSDRAGAFDLDDVATAEAIAQFLIVALRNARLYAEARRQ